MMFPEDQYFLSVLILGIMLKILLIMKYQLIKLTKKIGKNAKSVSMVGLNYKSLPKV